MISKRRLEVNHGRSELPQERGSGFDPVASLFNQFELFYVVGEERDLVRVRTNYRHETYT